MSLLAGIVSLRRGVPVSAADRRALRAATRRQDAEPAWEWGGENAFLVSASAGALGSSPDWLQDELSVTLVAGEPLIVPRTESDREARAGDVRALHDAACAVDWAVLRQARGTFCAAHYSADPEAEASLILIADKLGVRPIYYWSDAQTAVFATALRVLEALPLVPKQVDRVGVAELVAFGFPLGRRSPYSGISTLREAEIVRFAEARSSRDQYWRWDRLRPRRAAGERGLREIYHEFQRAIRERLQGDARVAAFLSGGMDSRAIVAALRGLGVEVCALTLSIADSQDEVYAARFARAAGCVHARGPYRVTAAAGFQRQLAEATPGLLALCGLRPDRPRAIWSGDGGSVAVGGVYLDERMVALAREGREDEALDRYLTVNRIGLPLRIMTRKAAGELRDVVRQGAREELARLECEDPAQKLQLFLMVNDQRRHLAEFYEEIDQHRLELQLPFFDAEFLRRVLALPLEYRLYHRFYTDWYEVFPRMVFATPWQTYPGHVSCPVPAQDELGYQWDQERRERSRTLRWQEVRETLRAASRPQAGETVVPGWRVATLAALHLAGFRDYGYALRAARAFWLFQRGATGGRHARG